ncbi:MAG: hypothetical protein ACI8QC_003598 [Planctomycetota bacterium]|jgi:hypothetical protein
MNRSWLCLSFLGLFLLAGALSPPLADPMGRESLTSRVLASYEPEGAPDADAKGRAKVAAGFLSSLTDEHRSQASFGFEDAERQDWTNVPPGVDEGGVRLGDCSESELKAALDLLAVVLSDSGYAKVCNILLADDLLLRDGQPRRGFGAENFWLAIFGEPSAEGPWALQLDGHHLALNMTFEGEHIGLSPTFWGVQPANFSRAGVGYEPMGAESAKAYALLASLNEEQRAIAIVSDQRGRIETAAGRDGFIPGPQGLACSEFGQDQVQLLSDLLTIYVKVLPPPHAKARLVLMLASVDEMTFSWSGPASHPADVSFRLQSPEFILEYACQDIGGKPLEHLHAMYREPTREYRAGGKK